MKGQTFAAYKELCQTLLSQGYTTYTVYEYIKQKPSLKKGVAVLRHDVDVDPHRALRMAKLEKKLGVRSTYYFRYIPKVFKKSIVRSISDMEFEIGYHYETLDKSHGISLKAISLFRGELQEFRKITDVKTVCSHGNVVRNKHYNGVNYDIFKFQPNLLHECDLIGEAYLSMPCPPLVYISDCSQQPNYCESVRDLIQKIKSNEKTSYYMSFHPRFWATGILDSLVISTRIRLFQVSAKALRSLKKITRACNFEKIVISIMKRLFKETIRRDLCGMKFVKKWTQDCYVDVE